MNLLKYTAIVTYQEVSNVLKPDGWHCWLKMQTHQWNGQKPEPGWSTKQCDTCGRSVVCGL